MNCACCLQRVLAWHLKWKTLENCFHIVEPRLWYSSIFFQLTEIWYVLYLCYVNSSNERESFSLTVHVNERNTSISDYRVIFNSIRWYIYRYRHQGTRQVIWAFYPALVTEIINGFYCEGVAIWHYLQRASKQQKHIRDPNASPSAKNIANIHGSCSKKPIWQCALNIFYSRHSTLNASSFP